MCMCPYVVESRSRRAFEDNVPNPKQAGARQADISADGANPEDKSAANKEDEQADEDEVEDIGTAGQCEGA